MMTIEQRTVDPGVTVLHVQGRICLGRDSQELEWKVDDLVGKQAKRIVLDLAGVDFLDSTGIGIIVMCGGKVKATGGALRISAPSGNVANTLALCKVTEIVPIFTTLEQAAASFSTSAGTA